MRKLSLCIAALLSSVLAAAQGSAGTDRANAIVDVRIDAPYRQVDPSVGDEWAPSWGRDDVLYTGSNDGTSLGGTVDNTITFGKLEGKDPYALKGSVINGMGEYREPQSWPTGIKWKTLDTYKQGGVLYRFASCASRAHSCLLTSTDGQRWNAGEGAWLKGTTFGTLTFISLNPQKDGWLGKSTEYAFAAAHAGLVDGEDAYLLARVPVERLRHQSHADWTFLQNDGSWSARLDRPWLRLNSSNAGPDGANWKTMNTYSVNGVLYMFITRCSYPSDSNDSLRRHIFQNASIIKSADNGRTWTRSANENFEKPMFPGKRFGTPYFVWYGKDGAASADNADKFVYAVSNNGHFENGDDYVLGRVPKSKIADLSAADWTFYTGADGMEDANWNPVLSEARPILSEAGKLSMAGMTFIEGLRRYVIVSWHYNQANFEAGIAAQDLSTVVQFFDAPKPWGPWKKVKAVGTGQLGWFAPIVGQRFQVAKDANTVHGFLYAAGFSTKPDGGLDLARYKLNYMPITLSTKPLQHTDPMFFGGR